MILKEPLPQIPLHFMSQHASPQIRGNPQPLIHRHSPGAGRLHLEVFTTGRWQRRLCLRFPGSQFSR